MHRKIIDYEKKSNNEWIIQVITYAILLTVLNILKNLRQTHGIDLKFVHKERKPYVKKYIKLV